MSTVLGATLLSAPPAPEAGTAPPTTYIYTPGTPPPSGARSTPDAPTERPSITPPSPSMVAMPIPEGYQRVAGPGGLVTTVPKGWKITRSTGPGAVQATDPDDSQRFVRYGGAEHPPVSLNQSHVDYAKTFAATKPGYESIRLDAVTYRGLAAVEWEFAHDTDDGRRRAKSLYWRIDGIEYFIYAASAEQRWPETEAIYKTMVANTTP
ncbi:hypothetical protein ACFPM7_04625 [Actinokineospora guangxiensis]|uniref:Serine/threonine protein kinase n=1 Tax=Actinokineospora guangxiensis TaxID=1490288 RepID=A0ABW0EK72_9PSEU